MNKNPIEWLYKKANIDIEDHKIEIYNLLQEVIPDLSKALNPQFILVDHKIFENNCANIYEKLKHWGISDRLGEIGMIFQKGNINPIHRDFSNWRRRNIALNLPVLNCEKSYTVWYDAEVIKPMPCRDGETVYAKHSLLVNEATAVEIDRCDSTIPHWINVYVPHTARVEHDKYRISLSIRFHPELFDIIKSGIFDSLCTK